MVKRQCFSTHISLPHQPEGGIKVLATTQQTFYSIYTHPGKFRLLSPDNA